MDISFINNLKDKLIPLEQYTSFDWQRFNKDSSKALSESTELSDYLGVVGMSSLDHLRPASVLISLVNQLDNKWHVILTQRAKHLKNHAGEICFPGGRFEEVDLTLQQTAIRETEEEIGLDHSCIEILGRLPRQITISQYYVSPYIAIYRPKTEFLINHLKLDKNEVENVFTVPLDFLLDEKNHQIVERSINGVSFSYYSIEYKNNNIWGATARMLVNFSQLLKK